MTVFRLILAVLFCGMLLSGPFSSFALAGSAEAPSIERLQQENAALKKKARRLEREVAALRDELNTPGASEVIGGLGYIVGIFGIVGWVAAAKKQAREG